MTVPIEEVKTETVAEVAPEAATTWQDIPSTETTEVKNTEETPAPAPEVSDDDALMNFFKWVIPADDKTEPAAPAPEAPKDEFHGAENSEPAVLKKENEALVTRATAAETALNDAKPLLEGIEKNPALKSLVEAVTSGKMSLPKVFAEYAAAQAGPATKTEAPAPAGNAPDQDNSPMGLVRRTLPRMQSTHDNGKVIT